MYLTTLRLTPLMILVAVVGVACASGVPQPSPMSASREATPIALSGIATPRASPESSTALASPETTRSALTAQSIPTDAAVHTPISLERLRVRKPSIAMVNSYLLRINSEQFPFDSPLTEEVELLYEDLNGDGQVDLVIADYLRVIILLWTDSGYSHPFQFSQQPPWKYLPKSRVKFEDWTNDSVPEVIFDHKPDTGGTGIHHDMWIRYIIHCRASSCNVVWESTLAEITSDYNNGGMVLFNADVRLEVTADGPTVQRISERFAIYADPDFGYCGGISWEVCRLELQKLNIYTTTLSTYAWTDYTFELIDEQIISSPRVIAADSQTSATNNHGNVAEIAVTRVEAITNQNDRCELILDGERIGDVFGCKYNFVAVNWQDITGDVRDEIVVTALSGTLDPEDAIEIEAQCVHQRLLVYEWDGGNADEVADVYGCVVQPDLFGVRIEDLNSDGRVEIISAAWTTPDAPWAGRYHDLEYELWIYRWNGTRFVYSDSIPGKILSD